MNAVLNKFDLQDDLVIDKTNHSRKLLLDLIDDYVAIRCDRAQAPFRYVSRKRSTAP